MEKPAELYRWAPLPLRLVAGYGFLAHGVAKWSRGADSFAFLLQHLAVPLPHLASVLTIGTEVLGGLALLFGVWIRWASIPLTAVLLTAAITVHWQYGFSSVRLLSVSASGAQFGPVGYELDLLYLACLAALVMMGSGSWSATSAIRRLRGRRSPGAYLSQEIN